MKTIFLLLVLITEPGGEEILIEADIKFKTVGHCKQAARVVDYNILLTPSASIEYQCKEVFDGTLL